MDAAILSLLVVAFATLLTAHVALTLGLARCGHRSRAALAFLIPPLAPYWGWHNRMRARAALWSLSAVAYLIALWLAMR
jgi:hypothetical protein